MQPDSDKTFPPTTLMMTRPSRAKSVHCLKCQTEGMLEADTVSTGLVTGVMLSRTCVNLYSDKEVAVPGAEGPE